MSTRPYSTRLFRDAARTLAAIGRRLYGHGWSPATSSNYSQRLNASHAAITRSGRDKGLLEETDIMVVNLAGEAVGDDGVPSAETLLHTQLYRRFPGVGAVLHTHSHAATVLTMHWPNDHTLTVAGYELLKALEGIQTHARQLTLPIFDNTQDIAALAHQVDQAMDRGEVSHAYLIRGHGLYTWAADMSTCYRQLEALETLLAVELERRRLPAATI
jgi:methylthioribulose-1-phosphate dehydratase